VGLVIKNLRKKTTKSLKMKRIIAVFGFAIAFIFSQNLLAQHHHPHHGPHGKRGEGHLVEMVKADLNLTAEQEAQLTTLEESFRKERREMHLKMRENEGMDREKMHEHMKTVREANFQKVLDILNPEQQAILKAKKEEMEAKRLERRENRGTHRAEMKKMHEEIKAYKEQNVLPTLAVQRGKLEQVLSDEDKATIAELRPIFAEVKEQREANMKNRKERKERPTPEMHEKMKAERKAAKEKMRPHVEVLQALVEKYDADIERLHQELETEHKTWKEDIKAINEKHKPANMEEGERMRRGKMHPRHENHRKMRGEKGEGKEHFDRKRIHFLLMEPAEAQSSNLSPNALTELTVFPNPASNMNTINYEVKQAGQVRIELKNDAGKTLRILSDSFKEVGKFSIEVDLANLRDGVYYYTITDGNGILSKKIVVSK
jgi:hypothetical protein